MCCITFLVFWGILSRRHREQQKSTRVCGNTFKLQTHISDDSPEKTKKCILGKLSGFESPRGLRAAVPGSSLNIFFIPEIFLRENNTPAS